MVFPGSAGHGSQEVKAVDFFLRSNSDVRRAAVQKIVSTSLGDEPGSGGLNDSRMGATSRRICATCNQGPLLCPGHTGVLHLPVPVWHPILFGEIVSKLRQANPDLEFRAAPRRRGSVLQKRVRQGTPKQKKNLPWSDIPAAEGASLLDPEWADILVITDLSIPPSCLRPTIYKSLGGRKKGHAGLTLKLQDITKIALNSRGGDRSQIEEELFCHIAAYMDRERTENKPRFSRNVTSLRKRISGKKGRMRSNIMGKRVDWSARSVITPCASLDVDEVGIPEAIANTQSTTQAVTTMNIARVRRAILSPGTGGMHIHSYRKGGKTVRIGGCNAKWRKHHATAIAIGDSIRRGLKDGDTVIINRQPSLHRHSMMAHTVKVMSGDSIRISPSATAPYNADFDGDGTLSLYSHTPSQTEILSQDTKIPADQPGPLPDTRGIKDLLECTPRKP